MSTTAYDGDLDILGQQPLLKIYTQIVSCYSVPPTYPDAAIVDALRHGLERLSASFPWVAGQVVNEGAKEGDSGTFKIIPREEKVPTLVVKDLRTDPSSPTMDSLRQSSYPMSILNENVIAPRTTLPHPGDEEKDTPVFALQATFVKGGLLLTFIGQHHVMDMTGQGEIISLLSKACRNEPFTEEQLSVGNMPRRNIIPLLDDNLDPNQNPDLARQIVKAVSVPTNNNGTAPQPVKSSWSSFSFGPPALAAMKATAMETLSTGFVSTDDTLSAFLWQSIARARLPRLDVTSSKEMTFARAIDVRPYLNLPATYTGLLQNMTYSDFQLSKISEEPLGKLASSLRQALNPQKLNYNTRALATMMERASDKSSTSFTASLDLSVDLMLSSWAKIDSYDLDFGMGLGKPEAVRRPSFDPVESLLYLCPKALDGEINVALCLRDEDMERLKTDKEFNKYAVHVG